MAQAADCGSVHEGSIPSGHPNYAEIVQRIERFGPNEEMPVRFRSPVPVIVCGRSSDGFRARVSEARGRWFDSSRSLQIFDTRGLGKRINPLGFSAPSSLGPRESRFESEVPDQFLWGSQVARRLAVNQFMRRFESCPHSQKCRGRLLVEGPSPTKRCSRVRSSTPVPDDCAPVAEGIQASLF